jgi:hypothetical protein
MESPILQGITMFDGFIQHVIDGLITVAALAVLAWGTVLLIRKFGVLPLLGMGLVAWIWLSFGGSIPFNFSITD